jgi:hypothetical protein
MAGGKARRSLALIEASLEILQQVQPATVEDAEHSSCVCPLGDQAPHPPGPTGRPAPSRKTTAVGSRYPGSLGLVRVPGDLAETGAAGDPPDPAGPPPGRGRRAVLPDPPRPGPVGGLKRVGLRAPGRRVAVRSTA